MDYNNLVSEISAILYNKSTPKQRKKIILEVEHAIHVACLNGQTSTVCMLPTWLSNWDIDNVKKIFSNKGFVVAELTNKQLSIEW